MAFIEQILVAPDTQYLDLLGPMTGFMFGVLASYTGLLLALAGLSLSLQRRRPVAAQYVASLWLASPTAMLVLGLLPMASLTFLLPQLLHGTQMRAGSYMEILDGLFLVSFAALAVSRRLVRAQAKREEVQEAGRPSTIDHRPSVHSGFNVQHVSSEAAGILALVLTTISLFFLTSVATLAWHPERWAFETSLLPWLFSVQVLTHFANHLAVGNLLAGAAILLLLLGWWETAIPEESSERNFLHTLSRALVGVSSLVLAPLLIWDLYTVPSFALSPWSVALVVVTVAVLFPTTLLAAAGHSASSRRFAGPILALALAATCTVFVRHQSVLAGVSREHTTVLAREAEARRQQEVALQERLYQKGEADVTLGKKVFDERCTACHRWDQKLVGPPFDSVVGKYAGRIDDLHAFIRNPAKVNPAYPPMPNPGLKEREIRAVAAYLVEESSKRVGGPK